jgi:hypothetical protein
MPRIAGFSLDSVVEGMRLEGLDSYIFNSVVGNALPTYRAAGPPIPAVDTHIWTRYRTRSACSERMHRDARVLPTYFENA